MANVQERRSFHDLTLSGCAEYRYFAKRTDDPFLLSRDKLTLKKTAIYFLSVLLTASSVVFFLLLNVYLPWLYERHPDPLKTCLNEPDQPLKRGVFIVTEYR